MNHPDDGVTAQRPRRSRDARAAGAKARGPRRGLLFSCCSLAGRRFVTVLAWRARALAVAAGGRRGSAAVGGEDGAGGAGGAEIAPPAATFLHFARSRDSLTRSL
jgi:hypothetical protein